jgi:hypothetical protein
METEPLEDRLAFPFQSAPGDSSSSNPGDRSAPDNSSYSNLRQAMFTAKSAVRWKRLLGGSN